MDKNVHEPAQLTPALEIQPQSGPGARTPCRTFQVRTHFFPCECEGRGGGGRGHIHQARHTMKAQTRTQGHEGPWFAQSHSAPRTTTYEESRQLPGVKTSLRARVAPHLVGHLPTPQDRRHPHHRTTGTHASTHVTGPQAPTPQDHRHPRHRIKEQKSTPTVCD